MNIRLNIRWKILLIVLPLLVTTLLLSGFTAVFSAETGITKVAIDFLGFKAEELKKNADNQWSLLVTSNLAGNEKYVEVTRSGITKVAIDFLGFKAEELKKNADNQWSLLVTSNLAGNDKYVEVTRSGIADFAKSLIRSESELIFALDAQGEVAMSTRPVNWKPDELAALNKMRDIGVAGYNGFTAEGKERVGQIFEFIASTGGKDAFDWYVVVSEERDSFFQGVRDINTQNYVILGASLAFAFVLLFFFSSYLTRPISKMVKTMEEIMEDNNLERRVDVEFPDEIGRMADTFNQMLAQLGVANRQIKNFALQTVLAKKKEQKIRAIFQKYVPSDVIDAVLGNPESMLVGTDREISILFSDIRGFTTISETMEPDELVMTLNRYFSLMVDIVIARSGTVDKYIGDAIMAFFGAPLHTENDALLSVIAGIEMVDALTVFNTDQVARGKGEFKIGIGINYGKVTVGNMGSEKKLNYTVIGDNVNLASRLEGLTKKYHQTLLFSESVYQKVGRYVYCRMLDKVVVKGKTTGESIYTAQKALTEGEKIGWATWHSGLEKYYARDFAGAKRLFAEVLERWLPGDAMSAEFLDRCTAFQASPPPVGWDGMEVMHEK